MPSIADFLRAILASPQDDAPRLIYADWLDEQGQHERAEFIRVQIRLVSEKPDPKWHIALDTEEGRWRSIDECGTCPYCLLCRRKRELLAAHGNVWWIREVADPCGLYEILDVTHTAAPTELLERFYSNHFPVWRRGFVAEIDCPAGQFRRHGAAILQAQPVEKLTLTGTGWAMITLAQWLADGRLRWIATSTIKQILLDGSSGRQEIRRAQELLAEQLPGISVSVRREPEVHYASTVHPPSSLGNIEVVESRYISRNPGYMFDPTNANRLLAHPEVFEKIGKMIRRGIVPGVPVQPSVGSE